MKVSTKIWIGFFTGNIVTSILAGIDRLGISYWYRLLAIVVMAIPVMILFLRIENK